MFHYLRIFLALIIFEGLIEIAGFDLLFDEDEESIQ
jgi:hypothetical protein